MKSHFKKLCLIFLLVITPKYSFSNRDLIIIQYDKKSPSFYTLKNALLKQMELPRNYISWIKVVNETCSLRKGNPIVGICIKNDNIEIFKLDENLAKNSLAKVSKLYQNEMGEMNEY